MMKKLSLLILLVCLASNAFSIRVTIKSGINMSDDSAGKRIKKVIENNASKFLTEAQLASDADRDLRLGQIALAAGFDKYMYRFWSRQHFRCEEETIEAKCIKTDDGYQVRGILVRVIPTDGTMLDDDEAIDEAVIDFSTDGKIAYFLITDEQHNSWERFEESDRLGDIDQILKIQSYVEQFRNAYHIKDIKFLEQIFSDDAIIVVGRVTKSYKESEIIPAPQIEYVKRTKREYLDNLEKAFRSNRYINVNFRDVQIYRHPNARYPEYYGVLVKQDWSTASYSDTGYVFLLWDFSNPDEPKIHVRTWQPINVDDPFNIEDFID